MGWVMAPGRFRTLLSVALAGGVAMSCAFGENGDDDGGQGNDDAWTPGDGESTGSSGTDHTPTEGTGAAGDGAEAADDGADGCAAGCETPPGDCFEPGSGACEGDTCVFTPKLAGESCVDDCSTDGFCDASGTCICAAGDGSGGMNGDCDATCVAGANATAASCDTEGTCVQACQAPYEDCDGDPSNGCEVPVGMPHMCDSGGINPGAGCWTAYCGQSDAATATNFGSYFCMDCSTCEEPGGGQCHWCNHDTGNFFPAESCTCGAEYLDAVCG